MPSPNTKQTYGSALVGCGIQGTIEDTTTYRLRRGNGHYNSKLGVLYQDKFNRVVPSSINNREGEPYRVLLKAAVAYWQNTLTAGEKAKYNRLAAHIQHLSGYNLFIKRVIKGEVLL